ncbi:hypothetical protein K3495_g12189 [Podosphaera aphanis]|nr:hypothetical protein K3495_g12189 [Podosphaera aphanis]
MVENKILVYSQQPIEYPVPGQHLRIVAGEFNLLQTPPPGGLIVKTLYASLDPYLRVCMTDTYTGFSLIKSLELGRPIATLSIAKVLESADQRFQIGDLITGMLAIQEYSIVKKEWVDYYAPICNPYNLELPNFLGVLSMTGLTAMGAFNEISFAYPDETMLVSSAAGAVGHLVGQFAMMKGIKVIGSVGTDEKLDYIVNELKFDGGFNYKTEHTRHALDRLAPGGIDIYFDNVGGEQLDAALEAINENGRIVCCGMISDYNKCLHEKYSYKNLLNVATKRLTLAGFSVIDFLKKNKENNFVRMTSNVSYCLKAGKLKTRNHVIDGIENSPRGFVGMLKGENIGKTMIKIAD